MWALAYFSAKAEICTEGFASRTDAGVVVVVVVGLGARWIGFGGIGVGGSAEVRVVAGVGVSGSAVSKLSPIPARPGVCEGVCNCAGVVGALMSML